MPGHQHQHAPGAALARVASSSCLADENRQMEDDAFLYLRPTLKNDGYRGDESMGHYKRGDIYWVSYSYQGKQYRESTGTDNKHFARDLLAKRQVEIREQRLFDVKKEGKVSFEELAQDFLRFCHERDRRSLNRAETSVKHLSTFFGGKRIAEITPEAIEAYVTTRLQQHSKLGRPTRLATVNRGLAALSKMFNLAIRYKKADKNPIAAVERLLEHNVRDRVL